MCYTLNSWIDFYKIFTQAVFWQFHSSLLRSKNAAATTGRARIVLRRCRVARAGGPPMPRAREHDPRLVARLGGEGHGPAGRQGRDRGKLRAHPPHVHVMCSPLHNQVGESAESARSSTSATDHFIHSWLV